MRRQSGWLFLAAVLTLPFAGCSQQSSEYREYSTARDNGASAAPAKRFPVEARKPRADKEYGSAGGLKQAVAAATGIGGHSAFNRPLAMAAEFWMGPSIGPSGTLVMVEAATNPRNGSSETTADSPEPPEKREPKVLVTEKSFREEGPSGAVRVTYDDLDLLKVLNMEPVTPDAPEMMPDWMKELDGKRIRIRGFMSPSFMQDGITQFLMGRDNKACCFPGKAKVYDLFPVKLADGETTSFINNRPFDVVGTFHIKPWVLDGKLVQIYTVVDARVIP